MLSSQLGLKEGPETDWGWKRLDLSSSEVGENHVSSAVAHTTSAIVMSRGNQAWEASLASFEALNCDYRQCPTPLSTSSAATTGATRGAKSAVVTSVAAAAAVLLELRLPWS